ncbi:SAM-dependent methyltransferase [Actinomadura sp. NPDC023710]|uniref:SAM-dependent methyltransferase n=1 Tax=Actinomadura sp. NPDC023710 TaxID=3158219 RepID=UPI0033E6808F
MDAPLGQEIGLDWKAAEHDLRTEPALAQTPIPARVWNVWAGGKDGSAVDEAFGAYVRARCPRIDQLAQARLDLRARLVRTLVGDYQIEQLLVAGQVDLPLRDEVHVIAQQANPQARVVYADPDDFVLTYARALFAPGLEGTCDCVPAALNDPRGLLASAGRDLDLDRPVGVLLLNSLGGYPDEVAAQVVGHLRESLAPGSMIAICDLTDISGHGLTSLDALREGWFPGLLGVRSPGAIQALLGGTELVRPGVVPAPLWRPDPSLLTASPFMDLWCGVGRIRGPRPQRRPRCR